MCGGGMQGKPGGECQSVSPGAPPWGPAWPGKEATLCLSLLPS